MASDETARLIEPQIPALRRYAYALTRDHAAADDLVQDCLERVLSRWGQRRTQTELRPWLFAILHNLHVDGRRRRQRRGIEIEVDDDTPWTAPAPADGGLELRDTLAALDLLPDDQKALLLLVGVEDLSYEEAARVVGVPIGTVMSRLARGRRRLRALLDGGRAPFLRRVK